MAKIKYASFVSGLSGKSGSSVFYRSSSPAFGYLRNHVTPRYTDINELRGSEMKNLGLQYREIIGAARDQFREYARQYSKLPASGSGELGVRANNGMAVFVAMVWAIHRSSPLQYDVESITLSDITSLASVNSIASAIEQGYLPAVDGYEGYDETFV